MQKLFIPKKIKVGFQNRKDTFTGKLAYVIYFDEKGVLRKEKSWTGWCDNKIPSFEFDNDPRSGYILNKGVQRDGYWGSGRSVIRVHDPREFEFEISVDNLIGILMHSDISKRDIVEECVFAWAGPELVLLPVNSEEYTASVEYTNKQDMKVSTKELVPGYSYQQKKNDDIYVYLGFLEWWDSLTSPDYTYIHGSKGKKHIFYRYVTEYSWGDKENKTKLEFTTPAVGSFSHAVTNEPDEKFAYHVDEFYKTKNSQPVVSHYISVGEYDVKKKSSGSSYNQMPVMYAYANDEHTIVRRVYPKGYDYYDAPSYSQMQYDTKTISLEIDPKGPFTRKYKTFDRSSNYYSYRNRSYLTDKDESLEQELKSKLFKNNIDAVHIDQQLNFLTEQGYGTLYFVLKNGTKLNSKGF